MRRVAVELPPPAAPLEAKGNSLIRIEQCSLEQVHVKSLHAVEEQQLPAHFTQTHMLQKTIKSNVK